MAYTSKQELIDRYGELKLKQLTDRTGAIDAIDDTVLGKAIADAHAEIDGYLAGRHALPLASVPLILVGHASSIALFHLHKDVVPEDVRARYDDAIKYLTKIAEGRISLGLDAGNQAQPEAGGPKAEGAERVFSREKLSDYLT